MPTKRYLSDTVWYGDLKGTIAFDVTGVTLPPESIEIDGETLLPKTEFHGSFLAARKYARHHTNDAIEAERLEAEMVRVTQEQLDKQPLEFVGFTGEYYLCEDGEETTIIGLVQINGADRLVHTVSQAMGVAIDPPMLHITLYKNEKSSYGIGIRNREDLAALCRELPPKIVLLLQSIIPTIKA